MLPSIFGENLFDDFFSDPFGMMVPQGRDPLYGKHAKNLMKTDVRETEGTYELDVDLPGFTKDEVNVELKNGYLTIQASKGLDKEQSDKKGKYIRQERYAGACSRTFYVGEDVEPEDVTAKFENGSPSFDIWNLQYCSAGSTEYEAVLSVLSSASYRQDLRNLLPGGLTSVSSDKDYDSRSVNLMFAWGRFEDECCSLTFSGSQVVVAGPNNRGFQVYHSVDPELLDRLIAEVQTYGVKN